MKKMNVLMSAAVAGLFAVSAHAADAKKAEATKAPEAKAPGTEKECKDAKMDWKDGKCTCATKNGCKSK